MTQRLYPFILELRGRAEPPYHGDTTTTTLRGGQPSMPHAHAVLLTSLPAEITQQIVSLAPDGFVTTILSNRVPDAEKIAALHNADFLLIHPGDIAERVLRAAPKLRLIQLLRVGYELMNTALLKELGIPFAIIGDAMAGLVADHAVLLMLAVYRNLVLSDTGVKAGRWDAAVRGRKAYAMDGKSVGILGMGHIGTQVARRVQGFGCTVQYHSRHALPADEEHRWGARYVGLRDLFATSDIVSLHVPLTPATRHLSDAPSCGSCSALPSSSIPAVARSSTKPP